MNIQDIIKAGKLSDAREELVRLIKKSPLDSNLRILLFQVLLFFGEWDKAERHIEILSAQDPGSAVTMQFYKNLIQSEKERREVFDLAASPSFLPEPPLYNESFSLFLDKIRNDDNEEAKNLFGQINSQLPVIRGNCNGKSFTGFQNTDTMLSFFLEAIVFDRYVWIPFEFIREITMSGPQTLFDLIWMPAHITTWDGLAMNSWLPALYPDSFSNEDDLIKIGHMTDWVSIGGSFEKGLGQQIFQVGDEEVPILEIREIVFKPDSSREENGETND